MERATLNAAIPEGCISNFNYQRLDTDAVPYPVTPL